MEQYRLYAIRPQNLRDQEPFFYRTSRACLVYTDGEPPKESREITQVSALPAAVKEWLDECITAVRERFLAEKEREILTFAHDFTQALGAELDAERNMMARDLHE